MAATFSKFHVIAFMFAVLWPSGQANADLIIYHFNVGMGDSTLIRDTDTDKTLLIDAGNKGVGKKILSPALKALKATNLDFFVATHYDADHIGGFDELKNEGIIVTQKIYDRGNYTNRKKKTKTGKDSQYGEYITAAGGFNRKLAEPSCVPVMDLGPKTTILIVSSSGKYLKQDCTVGDRSIVKSKDNDLSIALLVQHGDFSYFIGGDLTGGGNRTEPMEKLTAPFVNDVDVLKINHHGSETSSNQDFLTTLSPEAAIISVGNGGVNLRYRLPRQSILDRLAKLNPRPLIFLTNRGEGGSLSKDYFVESRHVVLHTNGRSYVINGILHLVDKSKAFQRVVESGG